jgi:hypothetical protein
MDDFAVFHNDKDFLWSVKDKVVGFLEGLQLRLHEGKCRIFKTEKGVPFLGLIIFQDCRRLKRENVVRFRKRMKRFQMLYKSSSAEWAHINRSVQSWIGHASHADTVRLRKLLLKDIVFQKGKGDRS